jgi:hypothetical protein
MFQKEIIKNISRNKRLLLSINLSGQCKSYISCGLFEHIRMN